MREAVNKEKGKACLVLHSSGRKAALGLQLYSSRGGKEERSSPLITGREKTIACPYFAEKKSTTLLLPLGARGRREMWQLTLYV